MARRDRSGFGILQGLKIGLQRGGTGWVRKIMERTLALTETLEPLHSGHSCKGKKGKMEVNGVWIWVGTLAHSNFLNVDNTSSFNLVSNIIFIREKIYL